MKNHLSHKTLPLQLTQAPLHIVIALLGLIVLDINAIVSHNDLPMAVPHLVDTVTGVLFSYSDHSQLIKCLQILAEIDNIFPE